MKSFFRAQLSSLAASLFDFLTTIFLVELASVNYSIATAAGAFAGAGANFVINRYWSFNAAGQPAGKQSIRYIVVWIGSLLLNVGGTCVGVQYLGLSYLLAKLIAAIIVGLSFNYILQKKFVFAVS